MIEEKENYYPKTIALLSSMAMRSNHGFGIYEESVQQQMIADMDKLYDAYVAGKTNEQISQDFSYGLVTISQVREEVNGKGFFKPIEDSKSFHSAFGKK